MAASEADHGQPERRGAEREKGDPVHALVPSTGGRAHRTRRLLRGELDVARACYAIARTVLASRKSATSPSRSSDSAGLAVLFPPVSSTHTSSSRTR